MAIYIGNYTNRHKSVNNKDIVIVIIIVYSIILFLIRFEVDQMKQVLVDFTRFLNITSLIENKPFLTVN